MTTAQQDADTAAPRDVTDAAELRRRAQEFVRTYVSANRKEPTGELVGKEFGMSERWGRNQVDAVRNMPGGTTGGTAPARRSGTSGTPRPIVDETVAVPGGTAAAARVVFGADPAAAAPAGAPARAAARPPAPPAHPDTAGGTPTEAGAARPTPVGAPAPARPTGPDGDRDVLTSRAHDATSPADSAGSGRRPAWLGFAFGALISILANVMDARIPRPPDGVDPAHWVPPADWSPSVEAQFGAAVWPIALLLSVEVLSRVNWPEGWQWLAARYGGVGAVGLFSAIISYGHIHDVLVAWGYGWLAAAVGPLAIDGLMVISGFALLAISRAARDALRGVLHGAPHGAARGGRS